MRGSREFPRVPPSSEEHALEARPLGIYAQERFDIARVEKRTVVVEVDVVACTRRTRTFAVDGEKVCYVERVKRAAIVVEVEVVAGSGRPAEQADADGVAYPFATCVPHPASIAVHRRGRVG